MTSRAGRSRLVGFVLSMSVLLPRPVDASSPAPGPSASPTGIAISFKMDPRLIDPTHGGTAWVSPHTYVGANAQDQIEARAQGFDAGGRLSAISARWTASDTTMVKVSPSEGNEVRIVVRRAGRSRVTVVSGGASQVLEVRSRYQGQFIQVEITQLRDLNQPSPGVNTSPARENPRAEAKDDGAVTLPSGLKYKVLRGTDGQRPTDDDFVECRYRISTANGQEVDASHASQPVTLSVAETSWKEALKLMSVGSRWEILMPPRPAPPGERPRGRRRAASTARFNTAMIVEVELLAIKKTPGPRGAPGIGPAGSGGISL
jgi:FKBP-type peptidyl-prolyl cis-trans isomerase FklB